ncbi:TMEM43 family protein [Novilysobacter antarcticus]|uniref:TMEM43 family protein n=1 Tax=Novilysobacter antarcticus TaxID=2862543 RepID=UPI001C99AA21|nr:TMEM43 family protein [Lysobacter antarcticus]
MSLRRLLATVLLAGAMACAWADEAPRSDTRPVAPLREPVSAAPIEDPDFGVRTSQFGLERRVEMYQWQRDGSGGYQQVWKPALVDSSAFEDGHANPRSFPLENRIWWARDVSIDGKPVELSVIKAVGQWKEFRPGFTRLPANLAATFQPEGDGLGSALNPLDPNNGDIRIRWRALHLPPLAGKVQLRGGKWQLVASAQPEDPVSATPPTSPTAPAEEKLHKRGEVRLIGKLILGVLLLLGVWLVGRYRRRRRV